MNKKVRKLVKSLSQNAYNLYILQKTAPTTEIDNCLSINSFFLLPHKFVQNKFYLCKFDVVRELLEMENNNKIKVLHC